MSEMRISIRLFDASKSHSILIDDETIVDGFLAAIVQTWNLDSTEQYLLYSLDLQGILHNEKNMERKWSSEWRFFCPTRMGGKMKITVSMEDVRQSASYLKQKANEYDAVVQKIYTTMHQLEAIWKGKDNEAFIRQLDAFQPQLKRMTTLVEQYGNYLQSCAAQYEQLQAERTMAASRLA